MISLPSLNYNNQAYGESLEELYDIINTYNDENTQCIIMGDFNCEISGDKCHKTTPYRGEILSKFISDIGYVSVNLASTCSGPSYTFDPSSEHSRISFIDHILVDASYLHRTQKCLILDDDANVSDHLPIILELSLPVTYIDHQNEMDREPLKWSKYSPEQIIQLYTENLALSLKHLFVPSWQTANENDVEKYYADILSAMKSVAMKYIKRKTYVPHIKPFWNETLKMLHKQMTECRAHWQNDGKPRGHEYISYSDYKNAKRIFRNSMRHAEQAWENEEINNLEKSSEVNHRMFWNTVRKRKSAGPQKVFEMKFEDKVCQTTKDITKGWAQYFSKLYLPLKSPDFDEHFKETIETKLQSLLEGTTISIPEMDSKVSETEVYEAVKSLPLGKAGGDDNVTYEHLKYGGQQLYHHLSSLFSLMVKLEYVPEKMKTGLMITILKPGKKDKTCPDSYRGITLLPVVYKVFEKVTLVRMQNYVRSQQIFPDPLRYAYQKNLSSINATFSIQETIKYCLERNSKVFLCLMDNVKAFDIVWHPGLFIRLYEAGISGKLWRLIINAYKGINNTVLFNGVQSTPFNVLQSTRQGSLWGAFFYLIFINPLIQMIRDLNAGAYVGNIFSAIHVQADDIALISTQKSHMQQMMDKIYEFSCRWRFLIHPDKTKILTYGEPKRVQEFNTKQRGWHVGSTCTSEIDSHIHCGILLSTSTSTVQRTKEACRKGRGVMLSLCNSIFSEKQINPITALKLYKSVTLPSAMFGCEIWDCMSKTEYQMLERFQRFSAKKVQNFHRRTRSNICCTMLGLNSVESYVDASELKFARRLLTLPG